MEQGRRTEKEEGERGALHIALGVLTEWSRGRYGGTRAGAR